MLKKQKTKKQLKMNIVSKAHPIPKISQSHERMFNKFIYELETYNKKINVVGRSTLTNPWKSHIIDCLQLASFIPNKNAKILDIGTGAGLPGVILSIAGFKNIGLVDSNNKKINFVKGVCEKLNLKNNIFLSRIEALNQQNYDYVVSRALAKLNKLFYYVQNLINRESALIFLKGKTVDEEINIAKKTWKFDSKLYQSISDPRGRVLVVKRLRLKK